MLLQADTAGIMWQMRANESLLTNQVCLIWKNT